MESKVTKTFPFRNISPEVIVGGEHRLKPVSPTDHPLSIPIPAYLRKQTVKSHCRCGQFRTHRSLSASWGREPLNLVLLKFDILDVRVISPVLCYIKIIKLAQAINVPN